MTIYQGNADPNRFYGSNGDDEANGLGGTDVFLGRYGNDILLGGDGDDYLTGGPGADLVDGGEGDDTLNFFREGLYEEPHLSAGDRFVGGGGTDRLLFDSDYEIYDLTVADIATDIEQIEVETGIVSLTLAQLDQFSLITGYFRLTDSGTLDLTSNRFTHGSIRLAAGNDIVTLAGNQPTQWTTLYGGDGDDQLTSSVGWGLLYGDGGDDRLIGSNAVDNLGGGEGNDVLTGGAGADKLSGDAGDDVLIGGDGNDTIRDGSGIDRIDAGAGDDAVIISVATFGTGEQVTGGDGFDTLRAGGTGTIDLSGVAGDFEALLGPDVSIVGAADQIAGFQRLEVASIKFTTGGALVLSNIVRARSFELSDAGNSVDLSAASFTPHIVTGGAGTDRIIGSSANDTLTGGTGDDMVRGGGGDDTLVGGAGNDDIGGGRGSDKIVVRQGEIATGGDRMAGGVGADTLEIEGPIYASPYVVADISMATIAGDIERLTGTFRTGTRATVSQINGFSYISLGQVHLTDGGTVDWRGKQVRTHLFLSNAGNRVISDGYLDVTGGSGADWVTGAAGRDLVRGGDGDDVIDGGVGDDSLHGQAGADILNGGDGDDWIDGGAGNDRMRGGAGNDTYRVDQSGDLISEADGGGIDSVVATADFRLRGNVENLTLTESAVRGTGNDLANEISGAYAADILSGGGGNDILIGNAGDDRLNGQAGADTMTGGTGDDTFFVDDPGDLVIEHIHQGIDTVVASVSYTLGIDAENLRLIGSAAIDGEGNARWNTLFGNAGANTLDGRNGPDRMIGGKGDDIYVVDDADDAVVERLGEGSDTVRSSVSFSLGRQQIENLQLTGTEAIDGTGNLLANAITGNAAANQLNGSGGDDVLNGGCGADLLTGGAGNDVFLFDAKGGAHADRLVDFDAAADTIRLDPSVFAALAEGALAASAFRSGTTLRDADDRIIYDSATGRLFYDADGSGAGAAFLFAQVVAGTALTHVDFEVGI